MITSLRSDGNQIKSEIKYKKIFNYLIKPSTFWKPLKSSA